MSEEDMLLDTAGKNKYTIKSWKGVFSTPFKVLSQAKTRRTKVILLKKMIMELPQTISFYCHSSLRYN